MHRYDTNSAAAWIALAGGGGIGGLVGGIALAMLMMVVTAVQGMGFLRPLYLIAATFHQPWAMAQGVQVGPLLIGLMFHMINSALFGLIFAVLPGAVTRGHGASAATWAIGGLVWGVVLLLVNQYVILPLVDPAMATATAMGPVLAWWVVSHLMYGLLLAVLVAALSGATTGAIARPTSRQAI